MKSAQTLNMRKHLNEYFKELENRKDRNITGTMGLKIFDCSFEEGTLELEFAVTPFMINSLDCLHGGVMATVLDITMGDLAYAMTNHLTAPTAQITVNYLRPAFLNDVLHSKAWCKKCGNCLVTLYAEITNPKTNAIIANGTANFCIIPGQTPKK